MSARNKSGGRDGNNDKGAPTSLEVRFAQSQLSRSRRQLIRAILDNHEEAFFLSSREMAKRYKVDAATIVRTIQALGYKKYAEFTADLRAHFVTQITPYAVLKAASKEKRTVADRIRHGTQPLGGGGSDPGVLAELDQLRHDVTELQERVDFTERLLSDKTGAAHLPRGEASS